ncbi:MAG TPA: hypothetical protein VFK43_14880 [Acidimicrobiales bacterium]|nr:hypothetical protein [Acidimicrobiales bacterium]
MATPLPPTVRGPILPSSTSVSVSGALAGAAVRLVVVGEVEVGNTIAPANGDVWVPLSRALNAGEVVFAKQTAGGETSAASTQGVPVIAVPSPLPAPVFASPVTECMDFVLLAGLVPGATVTLKIGATTLAQTQVTGTSAWVGFDPTPLDDGLVLTAVQTVGGASSPPAQSPPLAPVTARENLPAPVLGQPVVACDTGVLVSSVVPAGALELDQGDGVQRWVNIASTYWATGARPFQPGALSARQLLPGCGGRSAETRIKVAPATTPPAPVPSVHCPEARRIVVAGLKPGGVLTVAAKEFGREEEREIGVRGIGATVEQVDLPEVIGGQGPAMNIIVRQTVCGLTSPPGNAGEFARAGSGAATPPRPRIAGPLLDCMRAVPATDLLTGVLVRAVSRRTGMPLTDQLVVTSPTTRLPTWFPLVAGDEVELRQEGCTAPPASDPVRVDSLPSPLPAPRIRTPVRPGDRTVTVTGCLPGSRAHLLVGFVERAATDQTWTGEAVFHLDSALVEGDRLWAVQTMCTASSIREGAPVVVTKGRLTAEVTPASVPGGKAVSLTVTARDADTGQAIPGLPVQLAGVAVGVTGTAFGWTGPTSGTAASGVVKGGVAYTDAGFSIALRQAVPLNVTLFPGPVVIPGRVSQSDVTWTLTPRWAGGSPVTVTGNAGTAMIPPPPAAGDRVGVSLSLKAHLQGEIQGIVWPPETIEMSGPLAEVALTGATHSVSARFWHDVVSVPIVDDDGQVTGWEDKLAAGVQLFGVA